MATVGFEVSTDSFETSQRSRQGTKQIAKFSTRRYSQIFKLSGQEIRLSSVKSDLKNKRFFFTGQVLMCKIN
jgi:hypothetical protein